MRISTRPCRAGVRDESPRGSRRSSRRAAEWRRGIRKVLRDGGGVWFAEIIRVEDFSDVPKLMLDPVRAGLLTNWLTAVARAARDDAPVCLDCDAGFGPHHPNNPAAYLLVTAYRPDPKVGLVTGICAGCAARSDSDLMAVARRRLKSIWPDLRPLPPEKFVSAGGRA